MSTLFSTEMSTESLVSSTTSSSFTGDLDSYLDKIGSKAPQSWRKPRSRIYDHNRQILALVEVECENKWKWKQHTNQRFQSSYNTKTPY